MTNTDLYARKAREMTSAELHYAIRDVEECLSIWRDMPSSEPAMVKWHAEFDAYTAERQRRQRAA